jgi:hypothetical protein
MGNNKEGWFLEVAVFVEGGRKGLLGSLRAVEVGAGNVLWMN